MKKLTLGVILVAAIYGGIYFFPSTSTVYTVTNETPTEVLPEWAKDADAIKAAEAVMKKKELEAALTVLKDTFASSTALYEAEKKAFTAKKTELEKELGLFWQDVVNVKRLIRETFYEEPNTAVAVAMAESKLVMQQSRERYPKDRPEYGVKAGDRELSFCYFQIHAPAHAKTAKHLGLEDYATNPESCVKMARVVYEQAGKSFKPWTVFQKKMYLAYIQ